LATLCKVKCAAGLAELNSKRYKSAAKHFLSATFDNFNYSDVSFVYFYKKYFITYKIPFF
jgi:COP9 signalosome complex subunit 1